MLVDTIFYFYGVKIMKNIDNKVKLDSLFKDLNFNVSDYEVLDFTPYLIGGISNTTIYQLSLLVVLYGNR